MGDYWIGELCTPFGTPGSGLDYDREGLVWEDFSVW
jgi:hypothetical protein